ncbi:MAG: FAD-binding protein [Bacillota bacterium]|uniref:FAD-binding protein n=1 Tax=unclassified Virgibacillus TaxID=2620237 RepID=UPI0027E0254F|nr:MULTISPECIES: FAD-binding protein [unclassified Virgibacillus]MDY7046657.1 FAD-binding protein [Virgibacillus sp. M23]
MIREHWGQKLLRIDAMERQIQARDREIDNTFSKDVQVTAIRGSREYVGDKFILVASPHKILDSKNGPLIAVRLYILSRKTLGGLQTDLFGHVLDVSGECIQDLYAVREVTVLVVEVCMITIL